MKNLTKFALRRPVTMVLILITAFYFGLGAVFGAPMELIPDMEMPMMIVATSYAGASPEDVCELITKKVEDSVATLDGIDSVSDYSVENVSIVLLQYEYGTNMDKAYINLKKSLDSIKSSLPDDAGEANIMEMNMNAQPVMQITISGGTEGNLYSYVDGTVVPEIQKIAEVGEVAVSGGQQSYTRIQLDRTKMAQYHLDMNTVAQIVGAADYTIPAGSTHYGDRKLSVSLGQSYKTVDTIKNIVIPLSAGEIIHLSDIATVSDTLEDMSSIARYDGQDVVTMSIQKQQSAGAVAVSKEVKASLEKLQKKNPSLKTHIAYDSSDNIKDSLNGVYQTLIMAVLLSMLILFVFFGDIKASLIVGSSIPISVLLALVCMSAMGFSLNVISVGSLVLGVGMIVDNSIVVIESCFRTKDRVNNFYEAALEGCGTVAGSITGSTITTCVVFLPLALISGLSGQLFKQLGFTIVFCMLASLFSASTIAPLLYYFLHPREKKTSPVSAFIRVLQSGYRKIVKSVIPHHWLVVTVAVVLLGASFWMASSVGVELMPSQDEGIISVTVTEKPGMSIEQIDSSIKNIESKITADENVENYLLSYGDSGVGSMVSGSAVSISAYLKSDRTRTTAETISAWKKEFIQVPNCSITVENGSDSGMSMLNSASIDVILQGTDYDSIKQSSDEIVSALQTEPYVTKVHSSIENAAPVIKIAIDPVKAQAEYLTPASIASLMYTNMSGKEVNKFTVNGTTNTVRVEYPDDEFDSIEKIKGYMITTPTGTQVQLSDIADVYFEDSPQTIVRQDKQYMVTISGQAVEGYEKTASKSMNSFISDFSKPAGVEMGVNSLQDMTNSEMGSLGNALLTAIFLVFIVMAIQFESPKFSFMVMLTIPFSLIGAFGFLYIANCKISMISMIGFLMMVGTVVNNGILYVDTVNQLRSSMNLREALVEAGAIRLRPILMTTLTTIISMIPLCAGFGSSGEMLQGLALVNVGGLVASTILSLLLLPTFYDMWEGSKRREEALSRMDVD